MRRQLERTLADRMVVDGWTAFGCDGTRLECPRTQQLEDDLGRASKPGSAPMLWITALVSLRTGVLWSWRLGTAKAGERQHLLDLLEDLPRAPLAPVLLVCDAGYVGYELIADLARPGMLVPDPAVVAGTALQRRGGRGGDVPRGPVLVLDRPGGEGGEAAAARPGHPGGEPEAEERRLAGDRRAGSGAVDRPSRRAGSIG